MREKGVSVILCCYNSSSRIGATLGALAKQQFRQDLKWEIILVDNASGDNTAAVADTIWSRFRNNITMTIVREPKAGLAYARKKGIYESQYSILIFCDDDNWLSPQYLQTAFDILDRDPGLAACGGMGIPVFETAEPSWFGEYAEAFAVGPQSLNTENGKIINLYGAGLALQKKVIDELKLAQFRPLLQGRTGKKLSSAEDTELTYAFILLGYSLSYSADLQFQHYLPKERLTKNYLHRLFTAFGGDGPVRNLYYAHISKRTIHKRVRNWFIHFLLSFVRLIKYFIHPPKKNGRYIYLRWNIAYIRKLISLRSQYGLLDQKIEGLKKKRQGISTTSYQTLA